jgi:hypothetical protein
MTAKIKGRELAFITITVAIVGRTHSLGSGKFLRVPTGAQWWLSTTAADWGCPDFRTQNPKVAGSNPTPAIIEGF